MVRDTRIHCLKHNGYFEGYASVFGIVDEHRDRIVKGAFAAAIKKARNMPGMYFNHDPTVPVGTWVRIEEDEYGLYVVGKLSPHMPMSASVEAMMHRVSLGLSVGIRILKSKIENGIRNIYEVELHEISLTRQPANRKAWCFVREDCLSLNG